MSAKTGIQWTDATWNAITGCARVSPGCAHCFARDEHIRRHKAHLAGKKMAAQYAQPFEVVQLHPDRLTAPLRRRKPTKYFVTSGADPFHDDVPDEFIESLFGIMAAAPRHTFQLLTKRPERMLHWFRERAGLESRAEAVARAAEHYANIVWDSRGDRVENYIVKVTAEQVKNRRKWPGWPLPNVWLGVSVENQHFADERIPLLLQTPAAVRFLSCEPLLAPLELTRWLDPTGVTCPDVCPDDPYVVEADYETMPGGDPICRHCGEHAAWTGNDPGVNWVIMGPESGGKARGCDIAWLEDLLAQCDFANVPAFVKQFGDLPMMDEKEWLRLVEIEPVPLLNAKKRKRVPAGFVALKVSRHGGKMEEWPERFRVRQFPEVRA